MSDEEDAKSPQVIAYRVSQLELSVAVLKNEFRDGIRGLATSREVEDLKADFQALVEKLDKRDERGWVFRLQGLISPTVSAGLALAVAFILEHMK